MKTMPFFAVPVLTAVLLTTGAFAQTPESTTPPEATSPAAPPPAPDQVIYIPRLPSPAEVTSAAVAQGLTIEKIAQSATQVTVVYRRSDGQMSTVAYQLLPAAGTVATAPAATTTVVTAPPTVVYTTPSPVYYYDPFWDPWPWYGPVSIDLGFGFGFHHFDGRPGFRHGGFRHDGGFRDHGGFRGHGGGGFRGGHHRR